jgi:uncharacterized protein YndB with AHSA1/START domain
MFRGILAAVSITAALAVAGPSFAEVKAAAEGRLDLETSLIVEASPDQVYAAIGRIGDWWDPAHSYGGVMSVSLTPGGCFCEALPQGGGVKHGEVVSAMPGKLVRLSAALGPMQDWGVSAALTFTLTPVDDRHTRVTVTYKAGGFSAAQLQAAPGIDAVISGQAGRLKTFAETGKPTP